ncbi:MAG: hypothetical protein II755_05355, partial [Prevotella sp.]|nr:hypothetical protein [Prevotella sp.]
MKQTTNKLAKLVLTAIVFAISGSLRAEVVWYDGSHAVTYHVESQVDPVVGIALQMFNSDMGMVTGRAAKEMKGGTIRIYELDKASS